MTRKSIHADYPNWNGFYEMVKDAFRTPALAYTDSKILANNLIGKKIAEMTYKRIGGYRYLNNKVAFYYDLQSRLFSVYVKTIRRERIVRQVYNDLAKFLTVNVNERKNKTETTNRSISDTQQPILSLGDMSGGSFGAFKNRADWTKFDRRISDQIEIKEGIMDYFERDEKGEIKKDSSGKPIKRATPTISSNWKQIEERVGVGAILNALQFLETDLEEDLGQIAEDLMSPIDFTEGKFYTDPATGRVKFRSWEDIEDEIDPDASEQRRQVKSFIYDKNLSYPENLKNREIVLKEELKISSDKNLIEQKIHAGKCFIEAWEKPMELKSREEFDKIKEEVVGFEEFIEEVGNYLSTVRKARKSGKQVLPSQRFFLLLGPPGIGKTHIASKIADYLGKNYLKIDCAAAYESDLIGDQRTYRMSNFGTIIKMMMDAKDSAPVIVFDEIDKCRDENVLNQISILFDSTSNAHTFKDNFFDFPTPMNRVFFIATANNEKKLMEVADFVMHRCTRVVIKPLSYDQRIEIARRGITNNLKQIELEQYISRAIDKVLLKKCLVKEKGIRQTLINTKKITDQIDALDTKYGGDLPENMGKVNIPNDINFANYKWSGLIDSDGLDPNCPAKRGGEHIDDHKCFIPTEIPGWIDNMGE